MVRKALLSVAAIIGFSSMAAAQLMTGSGGAPAPKPPEVTEANVVQYLQQHGYSEVSLLPNGESAGSQGALYSGSSQTTSGSGGNAVNNPPSVDAGRAVEWSGSALRGGSRVNVVVDSAGQIFER
jgi:hypothetical protein